MMDGLKAYIGEQRNALETVKSESTANAAKTYGDIKTWVDDFLAKMQESVDNIDIYEKPMVAKPGDIKDEMDERICKLEE